MLNSSGDYWSMMILVMRGIIRRVDRVWDVWGDCIGVAVVLGAWERLRTMKRIMKKITPILMMTMRRKTTKMKMRVVRMMLLVQQIVKAHPR